MMVGVTWVNRNDFLLSRMTAPCRAEEIALSRPGRRLDVVELQKLNLAGLVLRIGSGDGLGHDEGLFGFFFRRDYPRA